MPMCQHFIYLCFMFCDIHNKGVECVFEYYALEDLSLRLINKTGYRLWCSCSYSRKIYVHRITRKQFLELRDKYGVKHIDNINSDVLQLTLFD